MADVVPARHVVVLAGGDPVDPALVPPLPTRPWVVAADAGWAVAAGLGLQVHLLVGDLDSVTPADLEAARRAGVEVEEHPPAKDRTDLAIALDHAVTRDPASITVVGGHGGRLDHLLGGLLLLAADRYAGIPLRAHVGPATVTVVRERATLSGRPGQLVSLLPAHGPAEGVTTRGLRFPLDDEPLDAGSSRGVSNELVTDHAEVELRRGVLLAVQPDVGAAATPPAVHPSGAPSATPTR